MSYLHDAQTRETRAVMLKALYQTYPAPMGESLLLDAVAHTGGTRVPLDSLRQGLKYLEGHGRIQLAERQDVWLARIIPSGVDFVESDVHFPALEAARRRLLRLRVLQALNALPLRAVHENLVRKYLRDDADLDIGEASIHRALSYLVDVGMAEWQYTADDRVARIASSGIDYLEGEGTDCLGVKRPHRL